MAKGDILKKLQEKQKKINSIKLEEAKEQGEMNTLLANVKEEDLEDLVGPLNKKLADLDVERKIVQKEKRSIMKRFAVPSGKWSCGVTKKGKNMTVVVSHSAHKNPFEKTVGNGTEEAIRKSYLIMRDAFIQHFKGVVTKRAAESYLTNTVRPQLGIS